MQQSLTGLHPDKQANEAQRIAERAYDGYEAFAALVSGRLQAATYPLFETDASGLWEIYLNNLPAHIRNHYDCHACRQFIERYGGLVSINDDGSIVPAVWPGHTESSAIPPYFLMSCLTMYERVGHAEVTGVFVTDTDTLGVPHTGHWNHLSAYVPGSAVWKSKALTARQRAAELREEYHTLRRALTNYSLDNIKAAVNTLRGDTYRAGKILPQAEWLLALKTRLGINRVYGYGFNIIWREVAKAPAGWAHISGSVLGSLMDDIKTGYDDSSIKRRLTERLNPLQYQRPQAAPAAGNIANAERLVKQLVIERSLHRRFARIDEIVPLWLPKPKLDSAYRAGANVFSGITPKNSQSSPHVNQNPVTMTWVKFTKEVLPSATSIRLNVDNKARSYSALVTATYHDAHPILQWDFDNRRNPVSWYLYHGGSQPSSWNLNTGLVQVNAVCEIPWKWQSGYKGSHAEAAFLILDGAKDLRYERSGNALFPEILKSELRGVRSTIEAYSKTAVLTGFNEASACGLYLSDKIDIDLVVVTYAGVTTYHIDRWD